ncbi:MAG: bifunctional diaminohydroxyphosphoribosylaminopyrimidine deaminase/5-amino-6-(5-phosphoribosylamino)uracil reductase RibD [Chitinophagales bacterium]
MKPNHSLFIQRCFDLAAGGIGTVAPNPLVGAVLVYENKIIAEGAHEKYGAAHAEVNCLENVSKADRELIPKSTLYVNLEPCSHFGKTPPCSDLIIEKKIPRLVYANTDPNPLVAGKGLEKLKKSGVELIGPIMEKEGLFLNRRFFTFHQKKRPYIILKWAQSKDGFINKADGKQNWITGKAARILTHQWRYEEAAILVGKNTIETDDPLLNNRYYPGENHPLRIVIDAEAELDFKKYKIGNVDLPLLVFNHKKEAEQGKIKWIKISPDHFLEQLLNKLFEMNIQSLIVEGGSFTLNQFIKQGLWDEARVFTGAPLFKEGIKAPAIAQNAAQIYSLEKDSLSIYYRQ